MVLSTLTTPICALLALLLLPFRSRLSLQLEILALRHPLTVYQRSGTKPRLKPADRIFWAWLSRAWSGWQEALVFAQPATVRVPFVLVILRHHRRQLVHFNVTEHPTAAWTVQARDLRLGRSSRFRKSVAFITTTNEGRPDQIEPPCCPEHGGTIPWPDRRACTPRATPPRRH